MKPFLWYNILMSTAPNSSSERFAAAPEESTSGILSSFMQRFETPEVAANSNVAPTVVALASRKEALNGVAAERNWLQRHTIDRFVARTAVGSELGSHSREIGADLSAVNENVADLADTWNDDRRLKRRIDQYQRYNRKYGDQARHVIESQIESKEGRSQPILGVIDENSTPEEIAEIEAKQEEARLHQEVRQQAVKRWERFAVQAKPGGRWRSKKLFQSALGWENIKNSWQNRKNMWSFFKGLGTDYAQWKAVKSAVPAVNVMSYGVREGKEVVEKYRETGENIAAGVELVGDVRRTKRTVRREGYEASVLTTAAARSGYIQNQIRRLMRGEVSRPQVLTSMRTAFRRFEKQDPQEFAQMIKGYGVTARKFNTVAGFGEVLLNAALWHTPWVDRGERGFWEQNETAVPIWGTYAAWRDIKIDNGLPMWTRVGLAAAGTALDVGTVLSFGTLSPLVAGAKVALVKGGQMVARKTVKNGAQRAAVSAGARGSTRTLAQVMGGLPRAAREAVTGAGAKGVAMSAAGYAGLSTGLDWLLNLEGRAADAALVAAEMALGQNFSYQQKRLLREVGQDIQPVVRDAYADYRGREKGEDEQAEEEALVAANDNQAPAGESGLTDGQIAVVSQSEEEKLAA